MPRDAAGNYTLPLPPVVPGTDIDVDWANPTMDDIAFAMSDSLSRTGSGGMLVPFKFADGAPGAPSITWTNQPQMGFYRPVNNETRYVVNGVDVLVMTLAKVTVPVALDVTGALTVAGAVTAAGPVNLNGVVNINGTPAASINDAITYAVALG